MPESLAAVAGNIRHLADTWPLRGAHVAARVIEQELFNATGGDGALSRMGGTGASVDVEGGGSEATATAGGDLGLWSMLENGTRSHMVRPKGRAIMTPAGPRAWAYVGGMAGHGTWSNGMAAGMTAAQHDAEAAWKEAVG